MTSSIKERIPSKPDLFLFLLNHLLSVDMQYIVSILNLGILSSEVNENGCDVFMFMHSHQNPSSTVLNILGVLRSLLRAYVGMPDTELEYKGTQRDTVIIMA